jgi:hypothetical protein
MWAADDDWHHPTFLKKMTDAIWHNPKAGLAFSHFTIFNHENSVRSPVIMPRSTRTQGPKNALNVRLLEPISNLVYGLMPTKVAREFYPSEQSAFGNFDWSDAFVIAELSAKYDVEIIHEDLFQVGIKTAVRAPTAANGKKISADTYFRRSVRLAFKTLPMLEALRLSWLVWRQTAVMDCQTSEAEAAYKRYVEQKKREPIAMRNASPSNY